MRVLVLNGPNLDLLGKREPEIYGTDTLADLEAMVTDWSAPLGIEPSFLQSNQEGDLVEAIHGAADMDGIVLNAAALTHTSRSIGDAIDSVGVPVVEVHISNIAAREAWRSVSLVSDACVTTIYGRGLNGYRDALRHLVNRAAIPVREIRYGPHDENIADLRLPDGKPTGLVVLVHGGFWMQQYHRDSMESLAVDLARRGMGTVNVEYRRRGDGGWPESGQDLHTALRRISRDDELEGLPVSLVGHSAGGYLALWAAARSWGPSPGLVVGLAPVTDLAALSRSSGNGAEPAGRLLDGGAPPQVGAIAGATLLVHGSEDDHVALAHSERLRGEAEVVVVEGLGHFAVLDPNRGHWEGVARALLAAST